MKYLQPLVLLTLLTVGTAACGDKKDSAERNMEAQKAIQEGMQKEKQMYEGMQKGAEAVQKQVEEKTK